MRETGFIPRLLITVPLEGTPVFYLHVACAEDEAALRGWLERAGAELAPLIAEQLLVAVEQEAA